MTDVDPECLTGTDGSDDDGSELQASLLKAMGADQECKTAKAGGCSIWSMGCAGVQASSGCKTINASLTNIASATNSLACSIDEQNISSSSTQRQTVTINFTAEDIGGDFNMDVTQSATMQMSQDAVRQAATEKQAEIQQALSNAIEQMTDESNGFMADSTSTSQISTLNANITNTTAFTEIYQTELNNIAEQIQEASLTVNVGNIGGSVNLSFEQGASIVANQLVQQVVDSVMSSEAGTSFSNTVSQELTKESAGLDDTITAFGSVLSSLLYAMILPGVCFIVGLMLFLLLGGSGFMKYFPWIAIIGGILMIILSIVFGWKWFYYLISGLIVALGIILVVVSFKTAGGAKALQTIKSQLK